MFTVKISKLKVYARIGVYATENTKSQLLLVTLKFSYKVHKNKNVDNIGNLKSYSEVKHFIKKSTHPRIRGAEGTAGKIEVWFPLNRENHKIML